MNDTNDTAAPAPQQDEGTLTHDAVRRAAAMAMATLTVEAEEVQMYADTDVAERHTEALAVMRRLARGERPAEAQPEPWGWWVEPRRRPVSPFVERDATAAGQHSADGMLITPLYAAPPVLPAGGGREAEEIVAALAAGSWLARDSYEEPICHFCGVSAYFAAPESSEHTADHAAVCLWVRAQRHAALSAPAEPRPQGETLSLVNREPSEEDFLAARDDGRCPWCGTSDPEIADLGECAACGRYIPSTETLGKAEAYDSVMDALRVALDGDTDYGQDPAELVWRLRNQRDEAQAVPSPRFSEEEREALGAVLRRANAFGSSPQPVSEAMAVISRMLSVDEGGAG
jgi:hypothetical protein